MTTTEHQMALFPAGMEESPGTEAYYRELAKRRRSAVVEAARCEASPTGAHHWQVGTAGEEMSGRCKYCKGRRTFRPFRGLPSAPEHAGWV